MSLGLLNKAFLFSLSIQIAAHAASENLFWYEKTEIIHSLIANQTQNQREAISPFEKTAQDMCSELENNKTARQIRHFNKNFAWILKHTYTNDEDISNGNKASILVNTPSFSKKAAIKYGQHKRLVIFETILDGIVVDNVPKNIAETLIDQIAEYDANLAEIFSRKLLENPFKNHKYTVLQSGVDEFVELFKTKRNAIKNFVSCFGDPKKIFNTEIWITYNDHKNSGELATVMPDIKNRKAVIEINNATPLPDTNLIKFALGHELGHIIDRTTQRLPQTYHAKVEAKKNLLEYYKGVRWKKTIFLPEKNNRALRAAVKSIHYEEHLANNFSILFWSFLKDCRLKKLDQNIVNAALSNFPPSWESEIIEDWPHSTAREQIEAFVKSFGAQQIKKAKENFSNDFPL